MSTNKVFAENLVKGKIAETIFAQMLRETGAFTVIEFGYEKVIPELIGNGYKEHDKVVETLHTAPDFAVINHHTRQVKLVEVKYRSRLIYNEVLDIAQRMLKSWNPSYLFVATHNGFYFDEVSTIIKKAGNISPLYDPQLPEDIQNTYLNLLCKYEPDSFLKVSADKSAHILTKKHE